MLHTKSVYWFQEEEVSGLLWVFFTMYGHGGHLGHVTNHMSLNFNFLVPTSIEAEFDSNGPLVSEKAIIFSFSCGGTKVAKFDHTIK